MEHQPQPSTDKRCNRNGVKIIGASCTLNNGCTYPICQIDKFSEKIVFDTPREWYKDGVFWSHLTGSNVEELHRFAVRIGLKREWFQDKPGRNQPHYDIKSDRIRKYAKHLGAAQVESKYFLEYITHHHKPK